VYDGERRWIGPFDSRFIPVTHSCPRLRHRVSHAGQHHPAATKLDLTPVDGRKTDLALIGEIAKRSGSVKLLLSDSTSAERPGFTPSESTVGATMRSIAARLPDRRFIIASFASHLHRVQQVYEADRRRPPHRVPWPVELHNIALARGWASSTVDRIIDIEEVPPGRYASCAPDRRVSRSALSLMAAHEPNTSRSATTTSS
jgi:ribonuclease J